MYLLVPLVRLLHRRIPNPLEKTSDNLCYRPFFWPIYTYFGRQLAVILVLCFNVGR